MGISNQQWPWFALMVRSNREKTASLLLENVGYECFLPTSRYTRRWSDRMKEIEAPLFPGYLFCRMNPHNRLPVLITPGVIQIVGVGTTPIPVEEEEIAAIQRVGRSGLSTMPLAVEVDRSWISSVHPARPATIEARPERSTPTSAPANPN